MKITIECTNEHLISALLDPRIDLSRDKRCWIARAVRDIFPEASITGSDIHPFGSDQCEIDLPQEAVEAILRFDNYLNSYQRSSLRMELFDMLQPFSFDIEINDEQLEQINKEYNYTLDAVYDILEKSENLTLKSV